MCLTLRTILGYKTGLWHIHVRTGDLSSETLALVERAAMFALKEAARDMDRESSILLLHDITKDDQDRFNVEFIEHRMEEAA